MMGEEMTEIIKQIQRSEDLKVLNALMNGVRRYIEENGDSYILLSELLDRFSNVKQQIEKMERVDADA